METITEQENRARAQPSPWLTVKEAADYSSLSGRHHLHGV